jgi:hypothetical protein
MLGSIVEKHQPFAGSAIKISSSGFPTISRRRNDHKLRDINDRNDAPPHITRTTTIYGNGPLSPSVKTDPSGTGSTLVANRDDSLSDNDRSIDEFNANRMMSMSTEELQSALEEVKSLLSDKSINFLSRGNIKSQRKKLHRSSDEGKHDPLPIILPPVNSGGPVGEATGITTPLVDSVRFDLNGCIVIDKAIVMERMVEELSQLLRPSAPGSHDELQSIAQACVDEMMPLAVTSQDDPNLHDKFFMLVTSSSQHLPPSDQEKISLAASSSSSSPSSLSSAELMHHQYEPHREGYNFSEINEVRGCSWCYW